jgi:hypothetical protein
MRCRRPANKSLIFIYNIFLEPKTQLEGLINQVDPRISDRDGVFEQHKPWGALENKLVVSLNQHCH